jgi:hypothetical protein
MQQNNKGGIDILLKKWELLYNHYKLQNESLEKRRNFLWLIQGALFVAWYNLKDYFLSVLIVPFGIFISIAWIIILKRDTEAIFLTEESLRDTECQFNELCEDIYFDRFTIDKICLSDKQPYKWKFTEEEFNYKNNAALWKVDEGFKPISLYRILYDFVECIINKINIRSVRIWLTWFVPLGIILAWFVLAIITLGIIGHGPQAPPPPCIHK